MLKNNLYVALTYVQNSITMRHVASWWRYTINAIVKSSFITHSWSVHQQRFDAKSVSASENVL